MLVLIRMPSLGPPEFNVMTLEATISGLRGHTNFLMIIPAKVLRFGVSAKCVWVTQHFLDFHTELKCMREGKMNKQG